MMSVMARDQKFKLGNLYLTLGKHKFQFSLVVDVIEKGEKETPNRSLDIKEDLENK